MTSKRNVLRLFFFCSLHFIPLSALKLFSDLRFSQFPILFNIISNVQCASSIKSSCSLRLKLRSLQYEPLEEFIWLKEMVTSCQFYPVEGRVLSSSRIPHCQTEEGDKSPSLELFPESKSQKRKRVVWRLPKMTL